ncbi:hypothetical protein LC609_32690 [Nostoc sp. XA013]|nr:hypothetical protein [Nostoc sp. XA013]
MADVTTTRELAYSSTPEIKNQFLEVVKGRDLERLKTKVEFYKNELAPYFAELSRRMAMYLLTSIWRMQMNDEMRDRYSLIQVG